MSTVLTSYKVELAKRGRKVRDLAESLGLKYNKVSRVLNGYDNPPVDFDSKVRETLKKWDLETSVKVQK